MVLDTGLRDFSHTRPVPALDTSLRENKLRQLIDYYLLSCRSDGKAAGTMDGYRRRLGKFALFLNYRLAPEQIDASSIRSYLASLYDKHQDSVSVNADYRVLHSFFNWAVVEKILAESPMANIKPPRVPKKIIKPLTREDIHNILLLCSGNSFLDVRNRAMVLLFLDTAIRTEEMANIQIEDVNFKTELIRVMGKGSKERLVKMGDRVQKALLRYLLMRADDLPCLWVTEERKPMKRAGIQIMIQRKGRAAGVKGSRLGPHTYRHTAAINFLRNGGDPFTLQIMLGHSTLDMTKRYLSTLGTEDLIRVHRKASPVDNMRL